MMNQSPLANPNVASQALAKDFNAFHSPASESNDLSYAKQPQLAPTATVTKQILLNALTQFESHGLDDLNNAKLMNRVDSKFVLPIAFLPDLLAQLTTTYRVLEINDRRISNYNNQYFDTPDLNLYRNHHNGKLNRYKVRRRHYVDTDTKFLEVKLKNNQKRTIKTRIKLSDHVSEYSHCAQFIHQQMNGVNSNLDISNLDISQQSGYHRIALANEAQAERLTLDFDLWYSDRRGNNKVELPGFFIAELKQSKKSKRSLFYQLMSANNIAPISFSKYCIGCALLYKKSIKTNRFKATLSTLTKYNHLNTTPLFKSN